MRKAANSSRCVPKPCDSYVDNICDDKTPFPYVHDGKLNRADLDY